MRFTETALAGAFVIDLEPFNDERGFFSRAFCREEFLKHGLNPNVAQCNLSYNHQAATLRGMHFQRPPHAEAKLIRCIAGVIYDVFIDLRPSSRTYCQWAGVELSAKNRRMVYVPEQFAHGYLTLEAGSEVLYQVSTSYHRESEGGVRWDDPTFQIRWPLAPRLLSVKDQAYPDFEKVGAPL